VKLGAGVDERCELDRLELEPVTFLNTLVNFFPMFLILDIEIIESTAKTRRGYMRVKKIKVSHPRVSSPCGAWLPLTKIILVGDDAPQNHSCGVVVPSQTCFCGERKENTKCK